MQEIIIDAISRYGYIGIFLLIAAENIFPPIPSEVILTFAGFACTHTDIGYLGAVSFATLGSVAGAAVLYGAGRMLSAQRLCAFARGNAGKALHIDAEDVEKAKDSFAKKGYISVLLCRCVPIMRSLISIPAGMAKMPFMPFLGLTTMGSTVWNMLLIGLGVFAGENWERVHSAFASASAGIKALILAIALVILFVMLKRQGKKAKENGL
ncbi:MAG: DedA family protein [Oscillospiraceae bacterium]